MSSTPPSCPRRTCSRHHLRRSPPSSSSNSLQMVTFVLNQALVRLATPRHCNNTVRIVAFNRPPSVARGHADFPASQAEKRIVKSRAQHLTSPSLRRSANRRSSCHSSAYAARQVIQPFTGKRSPTLPFHRLDICPRRRSRTCCRAPVHPCAE